MVFRFGDPRNGSSKGSTAEGIDDQIGRVSRIRQEHIAVRNSNDDAHQIGSSDRQ
jgi:hypothetical protein